MAKKRDLLGLKFGRLLVIKEAGVNKNGKYIWLCKCDCGNEKLILSQRLINGASQSCGCLHKEQLLKMITKHGMARRVSGKLNYLYVTWSNIKQRCGNVKNHAYPEYGGRGIFMCERWVNSFLFFSEDVGERPSVNHTLDRINNEIGYCPENCRWVEMDVQSRNKRNNVWIECNGVKKIMSDWAYFIGISPENLRNKLKFKSIDFILNQYNKIV